MEAEAIWPAIVAVRITLKFLSTLPISFLRTVLFRPAKAKVSSVSVQPARSPIPPPRHALTFCQILEATVTIAGDDLSGISFADQCATIAVAHDGLIVRINRSLALDQEVFVRLGNREVVARVMSYSRDVTYGLCFDGPQPAFWGELIEHADEGPLDAPPPNIAPDPLLVSQFEEFKPALPPKPAEPRSERRRSPRIAMRKAKACIEAPDKGSEAVELINVSRGGICFRSHRVYPLHCPIRVAAPYTEGGTNLFVSGRIVRVHRDAWGGVYGVEYTR